MFHHKVYIYPKLSENDMLLFRLGGPGLGNILFPWGRAIIAHNKFGYPVIEPTWSSLKIGPLLRNELDTRRYDNLFRNIGILSLIKKIFLLVFSQKVNEKEITSIRGKKYIVPKVIIFSGMEYKARKVNEKEITNIRGKKPIIPKVIISSGVDYRIGDLFKYHSVVKKRLYAIVSDRHLKAIKKFSGKGVSIHIRLGDFSEALEADLRNGKENSRVPIKWYIEIINKFKAIDPSIAIHIFSNGTNEQLRDVLMIPNVERCYFGASIADLLAMSKSEYFVASNSTFSFWVNYLGGMPTIWFPGTLRHKRHGESESKEFEIDYHDKLPSSISKKLSNDKLD